MGPSLSEGLVKSELQLCEYRIGRQWAHYTCQSAPSPSCALGKPQYLHIGEEIDGVDMRAEVGLLTRNIVVMGEMEDQCYPYSSHVCDFFDFDTFGGHIKVGICLAEALSPTGGIKGVCHRLVNNSS